MKYFLSPLLVLLLGSTLFAAADYESQTAEAKQSQLWQQIVNSKYSDFPEISGPGFFGLLNLASADFISKSFSNSGDEMEVGREKRIHTFGTVVKVSFVVKADAEKKFSGLFASGAKYGLLRLSLAKPPAATQFTPGFGMKLFRDHYPSANVLAMPLLDGISEWNLFSHDYLTALPKPEFSIPGVILAQRFESALEHLGQPNGNIRALSFDDMASVGEIGDRYHEVRKPYALRFVPTDAAKLLFHKKEDFRKTLQDKGEGIVLFDVYAYSGSVRELIGTVETTSQFYASAYGDRIVFFKHPRAHDLD